ncbi:MAG: hypothetical protein HXX19_09375 [Rhodoferax sp.]|nr:hypothetical protein [Rhodoferax sp.]
MATAPDVCTAYYWSDETLRSRSVGEVVLSGQVEIPAPPERLLADWQRDCTQRLGLEPGDVEALSLARARTRWPDYGRCVQALSVWLHTQGLSELLAGSDVALMACRGARYHHDGAQYGGMAFCNLFVSEDRGLDLHFPATGQRIPLRRGTVVVFDTGQPHAVIGRQRSGFDAADFPAGQDCAQIFLTWELPIAQAALAQALQVQFDTDPETAMRLSEEQIGVNGAAARLCPDSGRWLPPAAISGGLAAD